MANTKSGTTGRRPTKQAPKKVAVEKACKNCLFFNQTSNMFAHCHRYPEPLNVGSGHWCGEFKEKQ
jgi:hypothetical protein